LYLSPNIIKQIKSRRMRWVGHVACMGEERKGYMVVMGKPKGKKPLGRPRHRRENGIGIYLRGNGWCVCLHVCVCACVRGEWIQLV
jgi:hypothetical protein